MMANINFRAIIDYIRNFFQNIEDTRKRRATDTTDIFLSPKFRRLSSARTPFVDDWFTQPPAMPLRNSPLLKISPRQSTRQPRIIDTVVLDDDDVIEIKRPSQQFGNKFRNDVGRSTRIISTSTPTEIRTRPYTNGHNMADQDDDEVTFVKEEKSPQMKTDAAKTLGFNYIKPGTALFNIGSNGVQNGTKCTPRRSILNNSKSRQKSRVSSSTNYSFRIDDKMKYKKLLDAMTNGGNNSSSDSLYLTPGQDSLYRTPVGKLFDYDTSNRAGRILSMSISKSPITSGNSSKDRMSLSTKDTIKKVLDNFDEPVVVKESDSEDDVMIVSPPSPKPDIKVERVNSLKTVVDTSMSTKPDWLDEIVERNKRSVAERQREIDKIRECSDKTNTINKDLNLEMLRRKVDRCLQIKEAVLPVEEEEEEVELPALTDDHLKIINRVFKGRDPNEVMVRKFNLSITRRDLMTLAGLNWLNDEVINFYMNLLMERGQDAKWPKTYAFNTFFYPKLVKDGPQSLRRWTKRVDIFEYDLICVPVHLGMHWCMAIVDFRNRSIGYYDSMGSPNNRCLDALRKYLEAEHMDKKKKSYDTSDWELENVQDIPQQMNGSDCGMFACTFAEFITRNAKITFDQEDMPYLRKKMVVEIVSGELLIK